MDRLNVELLVAPNCPNESATAELLRTALRDVGLNSVTVKRTQVITQQHAEHRHFTGSPTIFVNGTDAIPTAARPSMACRIYPHPGGPFALPELRALRKALKQAAAHNLATKGTLCEPFRGLMPLPFLRRMQITPNRYPAGPRERATRMALDRLDEYGSAWAVAQALGPKLGVGPETLREWVVHAQVDAGARPGPSSDELAEIKQLKRENADLREANDILKAAASTFFASMTN